MKLSVEVINVLLLLLPGLVSSQIFYAITNQPDEILASKRIFDSIIFSFISYIIIAIFISWSPIIQVREIQGALNYSFSKDTALVVFNVWAVTTFAFQVAIVGHFKPGNSVVGQGPGQTVIISGR